MFKVEATNSQAGYGWNDHGRAVLRLLFDEAIEARNSGDGGALLLEFVRLNETGLRWLICREMFA